MTFTELVKDLIETSRERIKTPIAGAFTLALIIYNWRPIVLIFSSKMSIEDTIDKIDKNYSGYNAIIYPIGIAIIYTIAVPILMLAIDLFLVWAKKKRLQTIYDNKEFVYDLKIGIAKKVLELKREESEVDRLNAQLELAREHINSFDEVLINQSQKAIDKLKETEKYSSLLKNIESKDLKKVVSTFKNLSKDQIENYDLALLNSSMLMEKLSAMDMTINSKGSLRLSRLGIKFIAFIIATNSGQINF